MILLFLGLAITLAGAGALLAHGQGDPPMITPPAEPGADA